MITEFFLITDNLSYVTMENWISRLEIFRIILKILKILEFESIRDGATINSIEFEIFLFFLFRKNIGIRVKLFVDRRMNSKNFVYLDIYKIFKDLLACIY